MTSMRLNPPAYARWPHDADQLSPDLPVERSEPNEAAEAAPDSRNWPFMPDDVPPLAWWRTLPAEMLGKTEHGRLVRVLAKAALPHQDRTWTAALHSELPSAVAFVHRLMPDSKITLAVDLAMSELVLAILGGNAVAAIILSCALSHANLEHPFGNDIAVSWLRPAAWGDDRAEPTPAPCPDRENRA